MTATERQNDIIQATPTKWAIYQGSRHRREVVGAKTARRYRNGNKGRLKVKSAKQRLDRERGEQWTLTKDEFKPARVERTIRKIVVSATELAG